MVDLCPDRNSATYEIRLEGEIPSAMHEQFPSMRVYRSPVETVLSRKVTDLAELDLLLEQLQSLGVVLCEIRESPQATTSKLGTSLEVQHG